MPGRRILSRPPSIHDDGSSEEVEVIENKVDARAVVTADGEEDDESEVQSESSSRPIRSGARAFPLRRGTSGADTQARSGNAQTDYRMRLPRNTQMGNRPARPSRYSSFAASGSDTPGASASNNKRKKLDGGTTTPTGIVSSLSPSSSRAHPTSSRSSDRLQSRDRRNRLSVLIPQLPLETLRQYAHAGGTTRIKSRYASSSSSSSSSGGLTDDSDIESYAPSEEDIRYRRPTMARAAKAGAGRRLRGDPSDEDSTDILGESMDGTSDDGDGDSDSDGAVRKMTRQTRRDGPSRTYGKSTSRVPPLRKQNHRAARVGNRSSSAGEDEGSEIDELGQSMSSSGSDSDADMEGEDELDSTPSEPESDNSYDSRKKKRRKMKGAKVKEWCEKCRRIPATYLLAVAEGRKNRGVQKKRKKDEFELDEVEEARDLGGWLRCKKCVTEWHWAGQKLMRKGCLGQHQKDDVLALLLRMEGPAAWGKKRLMVDVDENFDFQCRKCQADPACFVCHEVDLQGPRGEAEGSKTDQEKREDAAEAVNGAVNLSKSEDDANVKDGVEEDDDDIVMLDGPAGSPIEESSKAIARMERRSKDEIKSTLRFRCYRCKQGAHYEHLPKPPRNRDPHEWTVVDRAKYYQSQSGLQGGNAWSCHQCREWSKPDIIIAWRPAPNFEPEPNERDYEPNWKDDLPREYLVRFAGRGFRHVKWVSHAWLRAIVPVIMLRKFLLEGPKLDLVTDETLAAKGDSMAAPTISNVLEEADAAAAARQSRHAPPVEGQKGKNAWLGVGPGPEVDAESGLPVEWSTVDRILDVCLRLPPARQKASKHKKAKMATIAKGPRNRVMSSDESEDEHDPLDSLPDLPDGIEPSPEDRIEIDDWEEQIGRNLYAEDVDEVAKLATWCFVKWDDLQHDQSTWDTPPPKNSTLYPAFKRALGRYLKARRVEIPILSKVKQEKRDHCVNTKYTPPDEQPPCVVGGTLMPFQLNGLQWMLTKHFKRESAILADDMGLGKTVQIASLLGVLGEVEIFPCLVVVPNSTITNWVREFEKWVPHMRVVPYYGEAACQLASHTASWQDAERYEQSEADEIARKVIKQYELYHKGQMGKAAGLKAHIVLTTYDMITGSDFNTIFASIPRWEVLCVDEGQRLKSDSSLIFARLRKLNTVHRLLLTGTPLNNNIRELFNLLNFLDPHKFTDRNELEARYQQDELNEEKIHELHEIVKPYILRRIKADVLKLPPKIEIIVPISLSPLQKHLYRLILDRNVDHIKAVAEARQKKAKAREAREKDVAEKKRLKEELQRTERDAQEETEDGEGFSARPGENESVGKDALVDGGDKPVGLKDEQVNGGAGSASKEVDDGKEAVATTGKASSVAEKD